MQDSAQEENQNMDAEIMATSAVEKAIAATDILKPFINKNDKEPSRDGCIYIYENSKKSKDNLRCVNVQVKGRTVKIIPKGNPTFPVDVRDLRNWLNQGGIILFVVYLNPGGEKIFYSALLPMLIRKYFDSHEGKNKISVQLIPFPEDNDKIVEVIQNFHINSMHQTSFANTKLQSILDFAKSGRLEGICIPVVARRGQVNVENFIDQLISKNNYMYAKLEGEDTLRPLIDSPYDMSFQMESNEAVFVGNQKFYDSWREKRNSNGYEILIGKSTIINFSNGNKDFSAHFRLKGNLSEQINDMKFFLALLEQRDLKFGKSEAKFKEIYFDKEKLKNAISDYESIKKMLDTLGASKELDIDSLKSKDLDSLRNFTTAVVFGTEIDFTDESKDFIWGHVVFGNIKLLICADRTSPNGYKVQSFFDKPPQVFYEEKDVEHQQPHNLSCALFLKKEDLKNVANINHKALIAALPDNDRTEAVINQVLLFMLELIKTYDEQDTKDYEILKTASAYCDWLMEDSSEEDIMIINKLQIIRRMRELNENEKAVLKELRSKDKAANIRCAANLLLGRMESAQDCFEEMKDEQKKEFLSFPIAHFGPHLRQEI